MLKGRSSLPRGFSRELASTLPAAGGRGFAHPFSFGRLIYD